MNHTPACPRYGWADDAALDRHCTCGRPGLLARLAAQLDIGHGPRALSVATEVASELTTGTLEDLVRILEEPENARRRLESQLFAERYPTTTLEGQTSTPGSEVRP